MPTFRNRQTGNEFTVSEGDSQAHASMIGFYEPVDTNPCPECDRTFNTAKGLAAHARTHEA